jgi:hypothetical protein
MSNSEDFALINNKIRANEELTKDELEKLIAIIFELDSHLIIMQSTLEFSISSVQDYLLQTAETVLAMSGRTDKKIKTKAAKFAAKVAASYQNDIQTYITELVVRTEEYMKQLAEGNNPEQTTEKEENNETTTR